MKKLTVLLLVMALLVFSGSALAQNQGYFEAKFGLDVMGEIDRDPGTSEDVETGYTLTGEYKIPMDAMWTYGAGVSYQLGREVDVTNGDDFNFTSVYALGQYNLEDSPTYLLGQLGFATLDGDKYDDYSGGLYYGLGAGFNFGQSNQYVAEFIYSVNSGEYDNGGTTVDVDYSKISMSVGMKF